MPCSATTAVVSFVTLYSLLVFTHSQKKKKIERKCKKIERKIFRREKLARVKIFLSFSFLSREKRKSKEKKRE